MESLLGSVRSVYAKHNFVSNAMETFWGSIMSPYAKRSINELLDKIEELLIKSFINLKAMKHQNSVSFKRERLDTDLMLTYRNIGMALGHLHKLMSKKRDISDLSLTRYRHDPGMSMADSLSLVNKLCQGIQESLEEVKVLNNNLKDGKINAGVISVQFYVCRAQKKIAGIDLLSLLRTKKRRADIINERNDLPNLFAKNCALNEVKDVNQNTYDNRVKRLRQNFVQLKIGDNPIGSN